MLQQELERVDPDLPKWRREAQHKLRDLDRQVTRGAINSLIEEMKAAYQALPAIARYLGEVQEDVLDHAQLFQQAKDGEPSGLPGLVLRARSLGEAPLRRYAVNLLIDHGASASAPIVYEDNPTHDNLVGRIEHISHMGVLATDFTLIKAGALHRANGGYLILDARKLLTQPLAWEALKRALRSREVHTEPLGQALGLISTQALRAGTDPDRRQGRARRAARALLPAPRVRPGVRQAVQGRRSISRRTWSAPSTRRRGYARLIARDGAAGAACARSIAPPWDA